jgi:gliding motility-associated-like protein
VYSVNVTGTNGCISVATATVYGNSNAPIVTLSVNSATITCSNPSVSINATVPGTVTSASYSWTPSSGISSGANSSTATFAAGGTYSLVVTDNSNGCSTTTVVSITSDQNPPSVSITASNPSITCTNGTVDISVNPVNSTDTYLWNGTGSFTGQGTATITTTVSGTYSVVVTNTVNGCSTTQTTSIGFNNNLALNVTGNTNVCQGSNIVLNGSGANTYTWTDGTNTYSTSAITLPASSNITFTLSGSTGACNSSTVIGIVVTPSFNVIVSANPTNSISLGSNVTLNASGISGGTYTWTPVTGLDNPNSPSPIASPVNTTTYCVTGISSNGVCQDSSCLIVYVDKACPEVFVPNVFSPNSDGLHDKLHILGLKCIKEFTFAIFDRWGEKVFESSDKNLEWDGTYNGKDMSGATFVYYFKGTTYDDKLIDKKGNITIVK